MIDIVIPRDNEKEFISIAEKLGYKELMFLYSLNAFQNKKTFENKKIKAKIGILADSRNIYNLKNKLKDKKTLIAVKSFGNDREIIEKSYADLIFSIESVGHKDFIHQRGSGLNHVMCKLAKEKKVSIGFSFNSILKSNKKYEILGRISQNIKLCRKYKVQSRIASFASKPYEMRAPSDLINFFVVLGMTPKEAQDSLKSST
jgi:RNase P/RNase MRP subunit p30|tara:strand:+ start:1040 stop:1645 length:606 start_codon:yes stop_codon:yes gene_type:complete